MLEICGDYRVQTEVVSVHERTRRMEYSSTHSWWCRLNIAAALLPGKERPVPFELEAAWLHSRSGSLEMRRNSCRFVGCPDCSQVSPASLQGLYIHFTHTNIQVKHYAMWSRQLLLLLLLLLSFIITTTTIRSRVQIFQPYQLFKVTEIKQICYFST